MATSKGTLIVCLLFSVFPRFAFCGHDSEKKEIREWTRSTSQDDFERNSKTMGRFGTSFADPSSTSYDVLRQAILILSQSPSFSEQSQALTYLPTLLSHSTDDPDFKKAQTFPDLAEIFKRIEEVWSKEEVDSSNFTRNAKSLENFVAPNTLLAKICAGTMCEPKAPPEDAAAIRKALSLMSPFGVYRLRGGVVNSYVSLWNKVISDPISRRATLLLAKQVIDRLESAKGTGKIEGDIFRWCKPSCVNNA